MVYELTSQQIKSLNDYLNKKVKPSILKHIENPSIPLMHQAY